MTNTRRLMVVLAVAATVMGFAGFIALAPEQKSAFEMVYSPWAKAHFGLYSLMQFGSFVVGFASFLALISGATSGRAAN